MLRKQLMVLACSARTLLRSGPDVTACIADGCGCSFRQEVSQSRNFRASAFAAHGEPKSEGGKTIKVTFVDRDGSSQEVMAPIGQSMLEVAHANDIDLEGACEGSLACSTCHVIVDEEHFKRIPEADDDENDMLDLAFGLTETSRLGCQVIAKEELDGMVMRIPSATRNFAVDGHRPKPH